MHTLKIITAILLCTAPLHGGYDFHALITGKSGLVMKKGRSSSHILTAGQFLYKHDRILLHKGATLSLIMKNGKQITLNGPYLSRVGILRAKKSSWFSSRAEYFFQNELKVYDLETLRSMESFKKQYPSYFPHNSYLMNTPTAFRWKKAEHIRFCRINIYKEEAMKNPGKRLISKQTPNTGFFPNTLSYTEEHPYSWEVLLLIGRTWKNIGRRTFLIISRKTKNRINVKMQALVGMKKAKPDDITPYIIGTIILIKEKLYHKALKEINIIISKHPSAAFPYMLRGRIYEEMNIKYLAAVDYKRAKKLKRR